MAQFKSDTFDTLSGRLGGMILHKNGVVCARVTARNPRTKPQQAVRNGFRDGSMAWKALTPGQQAGWSALSRMVTRTNQVGREYHLTGRALYLSCFAHTHTIGASAPADAPLLPPVVSVLTPFGATLTPPTPAQPNGAITLTGALQPENCGVVIRVTGPLSPDRNVLKPCDFRVLAAALPGASLPAPEALAALYAALYGPVQPGLRVCLEAFAVSAHGFAGPVARADVVAPA